MSIKLRRIWTNKNSCKEKYCLIFSRKIFYFTIVFCWNILWLKAINEITARQTRTSFCKHDVIKVCSIEYLTTQIELVLPTFFQLLDHSQNYRIFNVRAIVYEPEPLNGCHWYTKDGLIPLYIFEIAYVSRLLKLMPTSSGAQLLLCWQWCLRLPSSLLILG